MNNVANINDVSNSVKAMPLISHSGAAVVTTDMLADVYGTEVINIQVNHSRNKDRFVEGKHFYKLTGSILKEFKNWLTKSKLVYKGSEIISKHAKSIILWTERGAARHAKMLDTDQAWDVFEALEDFYFTKKEDSQRKAKQIAGRITSEQQEAIKQLVLNRGKALPKEKQAKAMITMWSSLKSHFGCTYKEIDSDKFTEALSLAARVPLEGEYLPKQTELPMAVTSTLTDDELLNLCYVWSDSLEMIRLMLDVSPLLQVAEHRLAPNFYEMPREAMRKTNLLRRTIEKATEHIQIKRNEFSEWRILHRIRIPDMPW